MDSDIRTDACPSPPRDEERITDDFPTLGKEDTEKPTSPQSVPKYPKVSKPKRSKYPNGQKKCDNVIYMNKCNGIHIGSSTTYSINVGANENYKSTDRQPTFYPETPKIKKLMNSEDQVTRENLIFLSGHITVESWKLMARKLGYSEGYIQHFYVDHHMIGMKEVIYQCLLDWIQTQDKKATIGKLVNVLWDCNEREAVELFSQNLYPEK